MGGLFVCSRAKPSLPTPAANVQRVPDTQQLFGTAAGISLPKLAGEWLPSARRPTNWLSLCEGIAAGDGHSIPEPRA